MTLCRDIARLLGRTGVSGTTVGMDDLQRAVRAGIPFSAFDAVLRALSLGREEVIAALRLPPRTIARRKREKRLNPVESEKLVRLARIAARASGVLGSEEKAGAWLTRTNRALGDQAPLSYLDTEIGASRVEEVLGRIEHGIPS
jgi:putative toxin-antitoxin system antitoxin component (TIGR02293 family)